MTQIKNLIFSKILKAVNFKNKKIIRFLLFNKNPKLKIMMILNHLIVRNKCQILVVKIKNFLILIQIQIVMIIQKFIKVQTKKLLKFI
jgi:hypothetical protein